MNIFDNIANSVGNWLGAKIAPYLNDELGRRNNVLGNYYTGDQRRFIKQKSGEPSGDNVIQNYVALAVDRSVSRLFRGGIDFNLPDGADAQSEYLEKVWDLNKKQIILYQVGLHGAVYGTAYFKLRPGELIDSYTGKEYPKLVAIDPEIIRIFTKPEDMSEVERYVIEYKIVKDEKEIGYREVTRHAKEDETYSTPDGEERLENDTWVIEEWEQSAQYGNQWTLTSSTPWPYTFPPIIHWKNLPSLKSCYGDSDVDDVINIQDKSNFVVSNTGKIIKFHAHPETIVSGVSIKQLTDNRLDTGASTLTAIPETAKAYNLEMQSDLASSRAFALDLRQSIFDIAREVDITSMADKLGALTNFGLQVLWSDAIDKNDTKRQLYGDAILELNRRLLVLDGYEMEASNPGSITWGDALPINIIEEMTADKMALELGIVDKETVAKRYFARYGVEWEDIQAALETENAAASANEANIGAQILRNFSQGQGAAVPNMQPRIERPVNGEQ